jgi:hypothetical protein
MAKLGIYEAAGQQSRQRFDYGMLEPRRAVSDPETRYRIWSTALPTIVEPC